MELHHHMGPNSKNNSSDLKQEFKEVLGVQIKDLNFIEKKEAVYTDIFTNLI